MKTAITRMFAWLLVIACHGIAAEPGPLAGVLQSLVDQSTIGGAVALVADRDRVLDLASVGYSSLATKEPMRSDALFWLASMTKAVTATALMMLVDEGKVDVNAPVEKYLPEFKGQMVAELDGKTPPHPPRHPVTVKELLTHTSGVIHANAAVLHGATTLKAEVAAIGAAPLRREPGTAYEYSDSGFNTVGRIVEAVSGMPYADFVQKRLLDPLEMKATTFWPNEEEAKRLVHASEKAPDGKTLVDATLPKEIRAKSIESLHRDTGIPERLLTEFGGRKAEDYANHFAVPSGGLFSTAGDIGIFCQMLLNRGEFQGRRYLSEAAVAQMSSNQTEGIRVRPQEAYGLGWSVKTEGNDGPSVGSFGHRGVRRNVMWIDPAHQLVMVLMIARYEMSGPEEQDLHHTFMKAAIDQFARPDH